MLEAPKKKPKADSEPIEGEIVGEEE
jgi:hypothetical protein